MWCSRCIRLFVEGEPTHKLSYCVDHRPEFADGGDGCPAFLSKGVHFERVPDVVHAEQGRPYPWGELCHGD